MQEHYYSSESPIIATMPVPFLFVFYKISMENKTFISETPKWGLHFASYKTAVCAIYAYSAMRRRITYITLLQGLLIYGWNT